MSKLTADELEAIANKERGIPQAREMMKVLDHIDALNRIISATEAERHIARADLAEHVRAQPALLDETDEGLVEALGDAIRDTRASWAADGANNRNSNRARAVMARINAYLRERAGRL